MCSFSLLLKEKSISCNTEENIPPTILQTNIIDTNEEEPLTLKTAFYICHYSTLDKPKGYSLCRTFSWSSHASTIQWVRLLSRNILLPSFLPSILPWCGNNIRSLSYGIASCGFFLTPRASDIQHQQVFFQNHFTISVCINQIFQENLIPKASQSTEHIQLPNFKSKSIAHLAHHTSSDFSWPSTFCTATLAATRSGTWIFPMISVTSSGPMAVSLEQLNSTQLDTTQRKTKQQILVK